MKALQMAIVIGAIAFMAIWMSHGFDSGQEWGEMLGELMPGVRGPPHPMPC